MYLLRLQRIYMGIWKLEQLLRCYSLANIHTTHTSLQSLLNIVWGIHVLLHFTMVFFIVGRPFCMKPMTCHSNKPTVNTTTGYIQNPNACFCLNFCQHCVIHIHMTYVICPFMKIVSLPTSCLLSLQNHLFIEFWSEAGTAQLAVCWACCPAWCSRRFDPLLSLQ